MKQHTQTFLFDNIVSLAPIGQEKFKFCFNGNIFGGNHLLASKYFGGNIFRKQFGENHLLALTSILLLLSLLLQQAEDEHLVVLQQSFFYT